VLQRLVDENKFERKLLNFANIVEIGKAESVQFSELYSRCEKDITDRLIQKQLSPITAYEESDI